MELYMDTERRLYLKDQKGKEYHFEPLGMGVPVQFVVETEEEREKKEKERKERKKIQFELDREKRLLREKNTPWYKKLIK